MVGNGINHCPETQSAWVNACRGVGCKSVLPQEMVQGTLNVGSFSHSNRDHFCESLHQALLLHVGLGPVKGYAALLCIPGAQVLGQL